MSAAVVRFPAVRVSMAITMEVTARGSALRTAAETVSPARVAAAERLVVAASVAVATAEGLVVAAPVAVATVEMVVAAHDVAATVEAIAATTDKAVVTVAVERPVVAAPVEIAVATISPKTKPAIAVVAVAVEAPAIPRAGADKHASREELRAVVAVWRASIRVRVIVAVRAFGRCDVAAVSLAYSNANRYLSLRVTCCKQENSH